MAQPSRHRPALVAVALALLAGALVAPPASVQVIVPAEAPGPDDPSEPSGDDPSRGSDIPQPATPEPTEAPAPAPAAVTLRVVAVTDLAGGDASCPGCDGISLAPILKGDGDIRRAELFWHYPHHQHYQQGGATPYGAIRSGDFKLIEFFNDMKVELYNIREDIGEQRDLASSQPKKVEELRTRLHAWRKEVGAQMGPPNPNYNPARPEYTPPPGKAKKAKQ